MARLLFSEHRSPPFSGACHPSAACEWGEGASVRFLQLRLFRPLLLRLGKTAQLQLASWRPLKAQEGRGEGGEGRIDVGGVSRDAEVEGDGVCRQQRGREERQPGEAERVDMIVLGDSYCDDVDMGFPCWPTRLASTCGWSLLSAAQGGSRSGHGVEQYERARQYAREVGGVVTPQTLCIVHLGGNDLLHTLWLGPIALLLLLVDLAFLLARRAGAFATCTRPPCLSFFGLLSSRISSNLCHLLTHLAESGHKRVLFSGLPLCSAVPTAHTIVRLLILGCWPGSGPAACVIVSDLARMVQEDLFRALSCVAAMHGVQLLLFDEAGAIVRISQGANSKKASIWRDGHHPAAWVHRELASTVAAKLASDFSSPGEDSSDENSKELRRRTPNKDPAEVELALLGTQ
ncbi:MAG: hypothetical protein SGPRY_014038 [Prymnesium sp.]